jgi:hypothetical protein
MNVPSVKRDTKTPGAALCLELAAACMRRGAVVSEPYGDNAPYDLVVEKNGIFKRVQVKVSHAKGTFNGTKKIPAPSTKKGGVKPSSQSVPYTTGSIDVMATQFQGKWYFYNELASLKSQHSVSAGSAEEDAWSRLGL